MNPEDIYQSIRNWLLTRIAGNNAQGLPNRVVLPDEAGGTGPIQSRQVYMPNDPRLTRYASEADRQANLPTGRVDMRDPAPAEVAPGGPMNVVDMDRPVIPPKFEHGIVQGTDNGSGIPIMSSARPEGTRTTLGGIPLVVGPMTRGGSNLYREAPPSGLTPSDFVENMPRQGGTPSPGQTPPRSIPMPLVQGTINPRNQPTVHNPDGSVSTVRTISVGTPEGEVLIPTVHPSGRVMTNDEAIREYRRTGHHLGIFRTPEEATAFAQQLHESEAQRVHASQSTRVRDQIERLREERNRRR